MNVEQNDFENWGSDWRSGAPEAEVSIPRIHRRVRRYAWLAIGNWLANLGLILAATLYAWYDGRPPIVAAAVAVWACLGVALLFELRFRRGTWRATGSSVEDFVDLARRQAIAKLKCLQFGWYLLAGEAIFFLFWIPWVLSGKSDAGAVHYLLAFGYLAAMLALFTAGLVWLIRRARRRIARFEAIRKSLNSLDRAA